MSKQHKCPIHGDKGFDQEAVGTYIPEPLTDCTCDVGATGPALTGGNIPVGPGLGGGNTPTGPAKK